MLSQHSKAPRKKLRLAAREELAVLLGRCQRYQAWNWLERVGMQKEGGCKSGGLVRGLLHEEFGTWPRLPFAYQTATQIYRVKQMAYSAYL